MSYSKEKTIRTYLNMARLVNMGDFLHASLAAQGSLYSGPGIYAVSERPALISPTTERYTRSGRHTVVYGFQVYSSLWLVFDLSRRDIRKYSFWGLAVGDCRGLRGSEVSSVVQVQILI